ncbi:TerD family protein [Streptomyces sp. SL13]|uniref:TerD family protein n=1 Tax=Streptantibioticus silvisoli TaxID=2705255 RepID=A0AA90H4B0_9ACTN|nr:TerD family protein [Streptantibioticus silvisoli]MDI5973194.1 TerD family protein [Streptantibioticus silvisoli]
MTPGSNVALTAARLTVEVTAPVALDVSALLVTADGKVRSDDDFVFYNQPSAPGVRYEGGAIVVDTAEVPDGVEKVVVTASPGTDGQTFAGTEPTATVTGDGAVVADFTPSGLGAETALVVVEVYRRGAAWKLRAVGQGYADGLAGIATDFGVTVEEPAGGATGEPMSTSATAAVAPQAPQAPTAPDPRIAAPAAAPVSAPAPFTLPASFPPPPAPPGPPPPTAPTGFGPPPGGFGGGPAPDLPPPAGAPVTAFPPPSGTPAPVPPPAGGKVNLDKGRVSLRKNESVSLVKGGRPLLSAVRMGLGWEPSRSGRDIDLDASVIVYGPGREHVDSCYFGKKTVLDGAIRHSGDNLTGAGGGDDETIVVHLGSLPPQAAALVFTVTSYSGQKFTKVARAYCRLLDDATGEELARFDLTNSENSTGVMMCKLVRQPTGEWDMTALGVFAASKTVRGMVQPATELL